MSQSGRMTIVIDWDNGPREVTNETVREAIRRTVESLTGGTATVSLHGSVLIRTGHRS